MIPQIAEDLRRCCDALQADNERLRGLLQRANTFMGDELDCRPDCTSWQDDCDDCSCGRVDLMYELSAPENAPRAAVQPEPQSPEHP
jgi:hypothetical protein